MTDDAGPSGKEKESMSKTSEVAKNFAAQFESIIEQAAQDRVQEILASALKGGVPTTSKTRTSVSAATTATSSTKKKRNYRRKPCPVKGCKNLAAPRHSMVCVDHAGLSQHEKDQYKADAVAPGGVWYQEKREKSHAKSKAA